MNLVPPSPASRYPLREPGLSLPELEGRTNEEVRALLGKPDEDRPGDCWPSPDPADPLPWVKTPAGSLMRVHVFGLVPRRIPVGVPYRTWSYHNVRGETWVLRLARQPWETGGLQPPPSPGFWGRLTARLRRIRRLPRPAPRESTPTGPPVVVETDRYPTGAVF